MKLLCSKSILICILFFLCSPFVWTQDLEQPEMPEQSERTEQTPIDTLQMYIRNAQYQQAVDYINRLDPTKELLYQKALCYKNLNDYSSAIEILNTLSEEYPDDIPAKLQLALCYEAVSQYMKSFNCYNQLLMIDSTNTYFEVRKADLLFRSERYASALDAYNRINPIYSPNYIMKCLGMCYEKLNQTDAAKWHFRKAWELNEQDAYSANSLVKIYIKEEDYLSAFEYSEFFIKNDSTNSTMNALNAFVYYNLDYFDIAIDRFNKCLQQGDSSLLVNRSLGFAYYLTDRNSLSRPLLQQAFLQDTTNTNILYVLGKVNSKLGYYPEAIECFMKMIDKTIPSNTLLYSIYKELAVAHEKKEAFQNAMSAYSKASLYTQSHIEKMEIYYAMATLSEEKFNDYSNAVNFYKQYYTSLLNYQGSLKDEQEINEVESKLTALEEYIKQLTDKVEKQRQERLGRLNQAR